MRGSLLSTVIVALLIGLAGPAAADTKAYDVALMDGPGCQEAMTPMCIQVEAANEEANGTIDDAFANITINGTHPIVLNVTNEGGSLHNLTFEPGTPAANLSHDDPLAPGDSVNISLTTVEDVPPGTYRFYSGMGADQQAGMVGGLTIQSTNTTDGGSGDGLAVDGEDNTAGEGNVTPEEDAIPAPGATSTLAALTAGVAVAAWRRR